MSEPNPPEFRLSFFRRGGTPRAHGAALAFLLHLAQAALAQITGMLRHKRLGDFAASFT